MKKDANQECNFVVYPKQTLWQRIRKRLFPIELCPWPPIDFKKKDGLMLTVVCECSLIPRLRFLITGRLVVEARIATENEVGKHASSSACYVATKGMTDK